MPEEVFISYGSADRGRIQDLVSRLRQAGVTVWIGFEKKQAVLRLAEVSATGNIMSIRSLSRVNGNRSSGMPRTILSDGYLWVTWTDSNRIRLGRLKVN